MVIGWIWSSFLWFKNLIQLSILSTVFVVLFKRRKWSLYWSKLTIDASRGLLIEFRILRNPPRVRHRGSSSDFPKDRLDMRDGTLGELPAAMEIAVVQVCAHDVHLWIIAVKERRCSWKVARNTDEDLKRYSTYAVHFPEAKRSKTESHRNSERRLLLSPSVYSKWYQYLSYNNNRHPIK